MTRHGDLRDAHLHLPEHGESLGTVDVSACRCVDACLELAERACAAGRTQRGGWVICDGARVSSWREERFPTAAEIDAVAHGLPVMVRSFDHHSASASGAALAKAGLLGTAHPEMDSSGHVWEAAYARLIGALPERTGAEERACVLDAQRDLTAQGFVLVHDMHSTPMLARTLLDLEQEGLLELRVVLFATPDQFEAVRAIVGTGTDRVAFGGLKLFTDGTLSGRTASMLDPYTEGLPGAPHGSPLIGDDALMDHLRRAHTEGHGVACHAIGDRAVRRLLEAEERLRSEIGRVPRGTLRIEHAQFVHTDDLPRAARLAGTTRRLVLSPQPSHLLTDIEAVRRFAPHAEGRVFPLLSMVEAFADAGLNPVEHIELGSDTPVVRPLPSDTILGACERRRSGMDASEALNPGEAIDEGLAWSLYRSPA